MYVCLQCWPFESIWTWERPTILLQSFLSCLEQLFCRDIFVIISTVICRNKTSRASFSINFGLSDKICLYKLIKNLWMSMNILKRGNNGRKRGRNTRKMMRKKDKIPWKSGIYHSLRFWNYSLSYNDIADPSSALQFHSISANADTWNTPASYYTWFSF